MKIEFREGPIEHIQTRLLVVCGFEGAPAANGSAECLPPTTRKILEGLQASGELTGKALECTLIHNPPGLAAGRLLFIGMGKKEKFALPHVARWAGTAVRYARGKGIHEVSWLCQSGHNKMIASETLQPLAEGAIFADYDADKYRTDRSSERRVDRFELLVGNEKPGRAWQEAVDRGRIIAESANFTRDLVNEPSNLMTPTNLADRAREMAKEFGLESQTLGPEEIRAIKMNAFWAVAQGSNEPPRLIVLRYNPDGAP
ncbi:MAG: M17 family peptidase N-terminal domain-containing protein, partial [Terriglobia bacterium]